MKRIFLFLIQTCEAFIISLIFVFIVLHYYTFSSAISNNIVQIESCTNLTYKIQQIADNVSNHFYKFGIYDCTQFSETLIKELKKINVSAYCLSGYYSCNDVIGLHTWSAVIIDNKTYHIESTSGEFINDTEYKKCYKEMVRGYCL